MPNEPARLNGRCWWAPAPRFQSSGSSRLTQWNHTVTGSYEIARNGTATVAHARAAFFAMVADRVKASLDEIDRLQPQIVSGGQKKAAAVPVSFSMSEDIYGKPKVDFSLSYRITGPDLATMIQASGMFRPVPNSNWRQWWASVSNVLGPRGQAGLVFSLGDDQIVDLFQQAPLTVDLGQRQPRRAAGPGQVPQGIFPEPTPENSWLDWRVRVYQETDSGVVEVRSLPTEPRKPAGDMYGAGTSAAGATINNAIVAAIGSVSGAFPALGANTDFFFPPPRNGATRKAGGNAQPQPPQRRARQASVIYLVGSALRVKYPIPAPSLTKWGEADLVPANRPDMGEGFWTEVVGNTLWPVYGAAFNLRYVATYPVSDTPPSLPNPVQGGGGQAPLNPNVGDLIPPGAARVPYGLPNPT